MGARLVYPAEQEFTGNTERLRRPACGHPGRADRGAACVSRYRAEHHRALGNATIAFPNFIGNEIDDGGHFGRLRDRGRG